MKEKTNGVYRVEKGIPMPESRRGGLVKYPFQTMDIGDSFEFPLQEYAAIQSACRAGRLIKDKRFSLRKETTTTGRIWRVE